MDVIDKYHITAEDIDSISALLLPIVEWPIWQVRDVKTQEAAQFSVAHVLSVVAHRIKIGPEWQSYETIMDPRIIDFRKKINFAPHPEWGKILMEDPRSNPASVEVVANGKTFREERQYARGTYGPEEVRMTDEQMEEKFRNNASGVLTDDKIDRATASIMSLENLEDTSELLTLLAP
jgi:2-methylcitrate dehydratase PrpD